MIHHIISSKVFSQNNIYQSLTGIYRVNIISYLKRIGYLRLTKNRKLLHCSKMKFEILHFKRPIQMYSCHDQLEVMSFR